MWTTNEKTGKQHLLKLKPVNQYRPPMSPIVYQWYIIACVVFDSYYPKSHQVFKCGSSRGLVWTSSGHIILGVSFNSKHTRQMIIWPKKHKHVDSHETQLWEATCFTPKSENNNFSHKAYSTLANLMIIIHGIQYLWFFYMFWINL